MRFAKGNFDLTYDTSLDPRRPMLLELPVSVLELIFKKANLKEINSLSRVCKSLKSIVEETKLVYKEAHLQIHGLSAEFMVDRELIVKEEKYGWDIGDDHDMDICDFAEAIRKIEKFMDHQHLEFENFKVSFNFGSCCKCEVDYAESPEVVIGLLKKIGFHVNSVCFGCCGHDFVDYLECLVPGKLETFEFRRQIDERMEEMCQTEQWKQARVLICQRMDTSNMHAFNLTRLEGFEEIEVKAVKMEDLLLRGMRIIIYRSSKIKKCRLTVPCDEDDYNLYDNVKQLEWELGPDAQKLGTNFVYRIQKDGKTFVVEIDGNSILIEKT